MLTLGFRQFFLSRVSEEHSLQFGIGDKARSNFMVVHTFLSLVGEIFGDIEIRVLGRFNNISVNFEGKSSELFIVDSSTSQNIFSDVLAKSFDHQMEL